MRNPWTMIGSDGIPGFGVKRVHPRMSGTFPRILGRYVREQGILTIEEAIRKMTGMPAAHFSLRDRGVIREGCFADIVVFDPATVMDRATFERPHQNAVGVRDVFVNGVGVWRDGRPTGATPGRALRGPGWRPTGRPAAG
jgi:N-acyl-D-aspartate/D-glutamate deacylase